MKGTLISLGFGLFFATITHVYTGESFAAASLYTRAIAGAISAMAVFALGFCVIPGWPTLKSNNKATDELWAKPKINNRAKIQPKNSPLVEEALRIMREAREEALRKSVDDS